MVGGDETTHRKTIGDMDDDEADAMIQGIRERRAKTVVAYEEAQRAKAEIREERARADLAHQLQMFEKELTRCDRAIDKIEQRALKIRALRLEIE